MDNKIFSIEMIRDIVIPIAKKYGVKKIALFGSYARKEQDENSDIDLIIDKGKIKGMFEYCDFHAELIEKLECKVDLLTYNSIKGDREDTKILLDSIKKDEVVLYEE